MFKLHKLLWIILICLSSSIEWLSDIDEMSVCVYSFPWVLGIPFTNYHCGFAVED